MPDNANAPGSAATSVGSSPAGHAPAASGDAGTGAPAADALTARLEALTSTINQVAKGQENYRSLMDRQLNDIRSALTRPAAAAGRSRETEASAADPDDNGNGRTATVPDYIEQDMALIKFRQLHADWQEYWNDMEPILADRYKAAPYATHRADGSIDYYGSIERLKLTLERDRLRKLRDDAEKARQNPNGQTREAMRRDAVISGQSASATDDAVDWSKLSPDEKVRKLYELNPELFDPDNLPAALRRK